MREAETPSPPRVALALSGGGSRAIAFHLGCLRSLERAGLLGRVQTLSAVSGGSVIAAMYCTHSGDFASFENRVRAVLRAGFVGSSLKTTVTTTEGLRALAAYLLVVADGIRTLTAKFVARPLPRPWREVLQRPLIRRFGSRTTILRRVFDDLLDGKTLAELRRDRPRLVIVACELRARAALYFTQAGSHCWRYGALREEGIRLSQAVAASAAYPLFLPALDEHWSFEKSGVTTKVRIQLTDGGVYDNLGLSPFWPGRDPSISLEVEKPEIMIVCRAGYALEVQPPVKFLLSRMRAVMESIHARVENLAVNRLFNLRTSGHFDRVLLAFLGQDDTQLSHAAGLTVSRDEALGYPADFSSIPDEWIDKLGSRGEQIMDAILQEHWPDRRL